MSTPTLEQYRGAIYGLAIGDALGWPKEGTGPVHVDGPVSDLPDPALYTDDTQMSLALARALLRAGDDSHETLMQAVAEEFVAWGMSLDNNRAPGATCMRAIGRLRAGAPWAEAGIASSKGCGTAMRTAPVGLYYHGNDDQLRDVARDSSRITHGHTCALAGGIATAFLVSRALDREDPSRMPAQLLEFAGGLCTEFDERIRQMQSLPLTGDPLPHCRTLGQGWVAEEAVALALYCFVRTPEDYRATVVAGANIEGDSDSVACIAGAISGAYNGERSLPPDWIRRIEDSDYLGQVAELLHAGWRQRHQIPSLGGDQS